MPPIEPLRELLLERLMKPLTSHIRRKDPFCHCAIASRFLPLSSSNDRNAFDIELVCGEAGSVKTMIDLPDDLLREVKIRAVVQGRTVRDLVADLLRAGLAHPPAPRHFPPPVGGRVTLEKNGLPVFRCGRKAPARQMKVEELLALEQNAQLEDDLRHAGLPL